MKCGVQEDLSELKWFTLSKTKTYDSSKNFKISSSEVAAQHLSGKLLNTSLVLELSTEWCISIVSKLSLKTLQNGSLIRILNTCLHKCFFIVESMDFNKLWLALFPMIWSAWKCNDMVFFIYNSLLYVTKEQ